MTKKKIIKLFAILAAVFLGSLEMGWRFFNMVVRCKRGEQKKERKKRAKQKINCMNNCKNIHYISLFCIYFLEICTIWCN